MPGAVREAARVLDSAAVSRLLSSPDQLRLAGSTESIQGARLVRDYFDCRPYKTTWLYGLEMLRQPPGPSRTTATQYSDAEVRSVGEIKSSRGAGR